MDINKSNSEFAMPQEIISILKRQKYQIVGHHSAVKKCYWLHKALTDRIFCYKCYFYGIESHRCIQMSPALLWCWHKCLHCWRFHVDEVGVTIDEYKLPTVDDPKFIVEESIKAQRRIISGYKKHLKVDIKMWEEACNPKHVAISLVGDATLYPRLGELIEEYHRRGITTFLVTRGVRPDVLARIPEPSQLYISVDAPNKELYMKLNRPLVPRAWELLMKTIELLPSFTNPTVMRITLLRGYNMSESHIREFAKLIEKAQPTYVEPKAYMHVGYSTKRLPRDSMPTHKEVLEFAIKLAKEIGYNVLSDVPHSRVVLLSRLEKPIRIGEGCKGKLPRSFEVN